MNDTKKTVCDKESYPPQTGDLLGAYLAKLSARVRELEESRKLGETPIENIDQLTVILNNWCSDLREWTGVVVRLEARVRELESRMGCIEDQMQGAAAQAARPEQSDFHRAHDYDLCECGHRAASHNCCDDGGVCRSWCNKQHCDCQGFRFSQPEAPAVTTPEPECATCGHAEEAHKNGLCNSKATYVSGHCGCHEYKDEFRDGVCTKCGHAESDHNRAECWGGSLGKPCQCREFTPVA